MNKDFEVVLVGSDMNAYAMARCCHEAYNKKAYIIGKSMTNFLYYSKIFNYIEDKNLADKNSFCKTLINFYENHKDKKLILIGTSDAYVRLIVENKEELKNYYLFNVCSLEILNNLLIKENFYTKYNEYDLDIPKTFIYKFDENILPEDIDYPLILKSSDGVEYYKNEFSNMSKVYKIKDKEELVTTINKIKESGYKSNLIIQEFIPGDDSSLFDSVFYFNKESKPLLGTFAQIGLQERAKTAVGNCTVLVNGYSEHGSYDEVVLKLKKFLESINYTGFAEVDLKYDYRDKKYKVLEINARQGRSSYYLTKMGYNLVEYIVEDLLNDKTHDFILIKDKVLLTFVPRHVINKYVQNKKLLKEINKLYKQKHIVNPMHYNKDMNIKRRVYLLLRGINYIKKYKENTW